jgi:hypothetical protein
MSTLGTTARILWIAALTYTDVVAAAEAVAETEVSPTQHRVALATAAAHLTFTQLHSIASVIADNRDRYGVSYRECGFVGSRAWERDEADYRKGVLAAVANCPDESLVHLAVLFAGVKSEA